MIITIKAVSEELKDDGAPKHIEWTAIGADGKEIKVKLYPMLQIEDEWVHLEERWDEFKNAKDKTYEIDRANIKVDKGYWKPVIKATEVKDVFKQKAIVEVQATSIDERQTSIEGQVALKEIGELIRTGKLPETHEKLGELYFIKLYDLMNKFVYGGKDETKASEKTTIAKEVPADEVRQASLEPVGEDARITHIRELAGKKHWKEATLNSYIKNTLHTEATLGELDDEQLTTLEAGLK